MMPSGPSNPISGAQSIAPSLLRSNSSLLGGGQAGSIPSQSPFSSLVSPRTQFNGNSLLGNISNVSSLLNQSFANGVIGSGGGLSSPLMNLQHRVGLDGAGNLVGAAEADPLSFTSSSGAQQGQHFQNPSSNQRGSDHPQPQQLEEVQNFQQQFSLPHNQQQMQQLLRGGLGNAGNMGAVKLENQTGPTDHNGPGQSLRNIGAVKLETLRSLGPVKMESQHSDPSIFLQQQQQQQQHQQQQQQQQHQQQQQQQLMQLSRQNSQAAAAQMTILHQQRILQLQQQQQHLQQQQQQHQQQQQILKSLPQQRSQLQQQLHQQNFSLRPQAKASLYEPGTCARRLTHYMYNQQHRPEDNNIEFWRKFVAEYFSPTAKKRWCVSLYGSGRQTTGVFPQDVWHCEICNRKPGRGFETTVEVLPRLCQIKYASGTLEELLYVDMPREYQNPAGQIVLDYEKAIQESIFEQLRVVREGQLRIVFNPDLKIASWEFCARRHEELIPRRLLLPEVSQLGAVVQKYQASVQNSTGLSAQDVQSSCNSFLASTRQLAKALEVPLVNELGYTKRYVRCLQIAEVVNSMKDLIDYSRQTGTGPMDSLINFPRRTSSGINSQQARQPEEQPSISQNSNHNGQNSAHVSGVQVAAATNGDVNANKPLNCASSASNPAPSTATLLQNSISCRQDQMNTVNGPYGGGNNPQIPSTSSSNSLPPSQTNPPSSFPSPAPSAPTNIGMPMSRHTTQLNAPNTPVSLPMMQSAQLQEADPNDSQSSVQQIIQEIMMSSQLNGVGSLGNDTKRINGMPPTPNGSNCLVGNANSNSSGIGGIGFGPMGGIGPSPTANGLRTMSSNAMSLNGRVGMNHTSQDTTLMSHQQQQDMGSQLLGGVRRINSFNNMQYDWKPSP